MKWEAKHVQQQGSLIQISSSVNLFLPNIPFLYPLKTSENQRLQIFPGGLKRGHWEEMG